MSYMKRVLEKLYEAGEYRVNGYQELPLEEDGVVNTLTVEDHRKDHTGGSFMVVRASGTVEWVMGEFISLEEMKRIIIRQGSNAVKVTIIPRNLQHSLPVQRVLLL